jgi:hypothetical protein
MADEDKGRIAQHDAHERWRCPMLGGPVHFGYCRTMNDGLPCARVLGCWLQRLPLVEFLKANYSPDQLQQALTATTKGRIERIMEGVENATDPTTPPDDAAGPSEPR